MKAIRVHKFGGPEVLGLEDVSLTPGPDEVLVNLKAIGVNPVDTYIRSGNYGPRPMPYTPGTDGAGIVPATGARVYLSGSLTGTYAEQCLCKPQQLHPLPDNISFEQGAALNVPYVTAYRGLFQRGGARPGETVLIHGASGGVGIAAVQFARAAGLTVIGTAGTAAGLELVGREGAHHAFDHHTDVPAQIAALTDGKGVNLILEMLANVNLAKDLTMLSRFGRVVVIGNRGTIEINPRETMMRDADIRGMTMGNCSEEELLRTHAAIGAGLENGTLRPVVGQRFPLAQAVEAHVAVLAPGTQGKLVLTV